MFRKIIIDIKEKYGVTYPQMLIKAGLPEVDSTALASYVLGRRVYPLDKLEKIFVAFGVEFKVK